MAGAQDIQEAERAGSQLEEPHQGHAPSELTFSTKHTLPQGSTSSAVGWGRSTSKLQQLRLNFFFFSF